MPKDQILLDPARTALVMIDLQNGILAQSLHPRSGDVVLENARNLIAKFRSANTPIVLVRVYWSSDMADAPHQMVDLPSVPAKCPPEDWGTLVDDLNPAILSLPNINGARFTVPILICSFAVAGLKPSSLAVSSPISAWNPPPGRRGNTAITS